MSEKPISLAEAEDAIECDPAKCSGVPTFKGTRIIVSNVAALASIHGLREARAAYPTLSWRKIKLAVLYMDTHPERRRDLNAEIKTRLDAVPRTRRSVRLVRAPDF